MAGEVQVRVGGDMRQLRDVVDDVESLPTDGLVVEEVHDEDTVRMFIRSWRLRVSQEYARSVLESYDGGLYPDRPHAP